MVRPASRLGDWLAELLLRKVAHSATTRCGSPSDHRLGRLSSAQLSPAPLFGRIPTSKCTFGPPQIGQARSSDSLLAGWSSRMAAPYLWSASAEGCLLSGRATAPPAPYSRADRHLDRQDRVRCSFGALVFVSTCSFPRQDRWAQENSRLQLSSS